MIEIYCLCVCVFVVSVWFIDRSSLKAKGQRDGKERQRERGFYVIIITIMMIIIVNVVSLTVVVDGVIFIVAYILDISFFGPQPHTHTHKLD